MIICYWSTPVRREAAHLSWPGYWIEQKILRENQWMRWLAVNSGSLAGWTGCLVSCMAQTSQLMQQKQLFKGVDHCSSHTWRCSSWVSFWGRLTAAMGEMKGYRHVPRMLFSESSWRGVTTVGIASTVETSVLDEGLHSWRGSQQIPGAWMSVTVVYGKGTNKQSKLWMNNCIRVDPQERKKSAVAGLQNNHPD